MNATQVNVVNNTNWSLEDISRMPLLATMKNNWRQRLVRIYQHPKHQEYVISVGEAYDGSQKIVCVESLGCYATAIDYARRGKVFVYE